MNKFIFFILLVLSLVELQAQEKLEGIWLSENLLPLTITKDTIQFSRSDSLLYWISKDTLCIREQKSYTVYTTMENSRKVDTTVINQYLIAEHTENKLLLQPVNAESKLWIWNARKNQETKRTRYLFLRESVVKETWLNRKKINLKKLAFARGGNEEDYSIMEIEIYRNRRIFFHGQIDSNAHPNHVYNGYYQSRLSKVAYKELLEKLRHSALNHVDFDWDFATCISLYQLSILDENGFAKYSGAMVPEYCNDLILYLDTLFKQVEWELMKKKYTFPFLKKKTKKEIAQEKWEKKTYK